MQLAGKRGSRQVELVSTPAGHRPLLYLHDQLSNRRFLVDSGAAISVMPYKWNSFPITSSLVSAGGHAIKSWGTRSIPLCFSGRRFLWSFLLADVTKPIIGAELHLLDPSSINFIDVLNEFPEVTSSTFAALKPAHGVKHFVHTEGPPVFSKPRRLDPDKLSAE